MDKWDLRFLGMADYVSSFSKDPSTKVGSVLVRDNIVIGMGFNGFPRGMEDKPEYYMNREEKYSRIVHGEINALIFSNNKPTGATLYNWPFLPCDRCAIQLIQAGVTKFVAPEPTADQATRWEETFVKTRQYAKECGVEIMEIPRVELGI